MMTSIGKTIIKTILAVIPENTLAALIAEYVTKAMQKIKDKDHMAKVSAAVSATMLAGKTISDSAEDCEFTEDEVNLVSNNIQIAVQKIVEAAK